MQYQMLYLLPHDPVVMIEKNIVQDNLVENPNIENDKKPNIN